MQAADFRKRWEEAQMDIQILLTRSIETQQQLHTLIGIQRELYAGVLGEEAPEIEVRTRVVRTA